MPEIKNKKLAFDPSCQRDDGWVSKQEGGGWDLTGSEARLRID